MFEDVLTKSYYGNTIADYLLAFVLIVATFVIAKLAYWLIGRFLKSLTKRSKSEFDDILVDKLEEPLVFAVIIFGIWFSLSVLEQSEATKGVISAAYYVLIIFNVAWIIARMVDALMKRFIAPLVEATESRLDDQVLPILEKGLKISIWVIAFLVALNNAGYNVGAVLASLGIGGIAFAMAAKDTIANLFGSFTIFVDKPFTVGDRVVINGFDGFIREIGIRSTRIETLNGRMVTMPNSRVADESIENVTSEPNRKMAMDLGLTYDTDDEGMKKAINILHEIVAANDDVEDNLVANFDAFNDFSLNIRFIYYIRKGQGVAATQTAINLEILRRFNEAGLEFAFPTQTIYNIPAREA